MRRLLIAIVGLLAVAGPSSASAESLSLAAALDLAMGQSPRVEASAAATEAARGGVTEATGAFTPRVGVSQTYMRTDDPVGVFAAKLQQGKFTAGDFALPVLNDPNGINDWVTRVEVAQPIFHSGIDWAQRRAAVERLNAQGHQESFDRARVRLAVTNLYFAAVAMNRQHTAIADGIRKLKSLEASYQLMEAPTSASTTSYLVARSVRTNLESELLKVACMRDKALRDLNVVLGQGPETSLSLTDPLPPVAGLRDASDRPTPAADDAPEEGGTGLRPDVEAGRAQARAAKAERDAAVRRWGPDFDFFGAYSVHTGNFESSKGMYEVGARLSLPLVSVARQGTIRRAKAEQKRSEEAARAQELEAAADLATAEANLASCVERYGIVGRAAATAEEAMRVAMTRYDEGTLPLMDFSDAIQNWVEMRVRHVEGHLNAAIARTMVDFHRNTL